MSEFNTGRRILRAFAKSVLAVVILIVLFIGVGYLATWGERSMPRTTAQDPSLPHVILNNYRFHAEAFGPRGAPVVIALHGGPGNDYRYILPLKGLANRYRVVFYDQRGAGLSPRVTADQLTLETYIKDLAAFQTHYAPNKPVILIGHSWGAMLATTYMARFPKRVSRAVLAEPGILTNEAAAAFMQEVLSPPGLSFFAHIIVTRLRAMHVSGPDSQATADYFQTHALLRYTGNDHPLARYYCSGRSPLIGFKDWRFGALASRTLQSQARDKNGQFQMNLARGIENWKGEALFLTGSCNTLIGATWQKKYHLKLFKRARLTVIADAGHMMFGERPQSSLKAIRAFLR